VDRIRKWISKNGIKWKSALNTEINYIQEIDEESLKEGTLNLFPVSISSINQKIHLSIYLIMPRRGISAIKF